MKSYLLILEPRAIEDIQHALDYYKNIYGRLSEKFFTALEKTFEQIKQNPFYQIKYENVRCLQIKKFPYAVHYLIDEQFDEIKIMAIVHTASDPDKIWMWQEE